MAFQHFLIGVVDDDPRVLESLEELLAAGGYKALAFPSAEAFLEANEHQAVDCVISDIGMPGMSGWELLRVACKRYPNLPVVLITALDEEHTQESTEANGVRCFFRKPFDGGELLNALNGILNPVQSSAELKPRSV